MLTTHPYLVPRSWMSRSYTPLPPSASMACRGTALLYFTLLYFIYIYIYIYTHTHTHTHTYIHIYIHAHTRGMSRKFRSRIPAAQVAWAGCACAVMSQEPRRLHQTHCHFSFFVYKFVILSWNKYENRKSRNLWDTVCDQISECQNVRPAEIYRQFC
jgi:hypothetical protein